MTPDKKLKAALERIEDRAIYEGKSTRDDKIRTQRDIQNIRALLETHVLVPKEASDAMLIAGRKANVGPRSCAHGYIYKAMIETQEKS